MRYRVLGPVHMAPRTPSAAKPRAVLATLLMQSNTVVSTHTLIDELWSSEPPRTATTTLQVYVSQLRKALLEGADAAAEESGTVQPLLTRPPGYLMRVAPDELDLSVFESLRTEGRAAYDQREYGTASHLLGRALGLWTGPALSGIPHGPALETSAIRLNELRAEVLEQRISADLRLGRHHELVGELMALAHDHPLRETLHCHLMVALYRSGRQSDALQVYHRARRSLVDELGVEPGPVLSRLLERILASDPSLAWHGEPEPRLSPVGGSGGRAAGEPVGGAAVPASSSALGGRGGPDQGPVVWLPPTVADFTGREDQLAAGEKLLAGDPAVPNKVLVVSGRAGAGKTALAVRLAHDAADRFPDGRVLVTLRDAGGRAVEPRTAMATLLRRLRGPLGAEPGADGGTDPLPSSEAELAELLHGHTEGRRMLLVLDDAVSEAQVRPVLSAVPDSTVVLTSRQVLGALEGVQHLTLDVLTVREAEELLMTCGGPRMREDPEAAGEIARLCGCLPLALRVAAAGIAARPHWTAAGLAQRLRDERTRLAALALGDLDVRSSLLTAYHDVGEEARHAFRILGLASLPDFALWSASALLDADPAEAERLTEELVRAHLLEARRRPGRLAPVRYGFHALLRSLSLEVLARESPQEGPAAVERLCRAFLALARHADAKLAPGRDRLVQEEAEPVAGISPDEVVGNAPLQWFQEESAGLSEAVRQAHAAGLWSLCCSLASAAAGYYEAGALWDEWESTHDLALDAARQAGDLHAEAVVLRSLGDLAWQRHQTSLSIDRYRLAWHLFTRHGDRAAAGRCLSAEADVLLGLGRVEQAERCYVRALSANRLDNDARGAADSLRGLALVALREGRHEEALGHLTECESAARSAGDHRWLQYARRTAAAVRTFLTSSRSASASSIPLEIRPGVWLFSPPQPAQRAA
ncbi:AfsR/SARP family transcriptional regulator [Streptomyces sp. GC420]|uniref:AfsR/SARP family transcriptional regulator n=1 Tax=Streptomyces sp. GC420 TaxID=2697568 RepID=UPI001414EE72|nr:AfsR/SARP family transcriptional regulator [Streptomyces sp. GC420]NBM17268.1 tetratricopeptide repeat protein [Streptomyces sp. GC420]